MIFESYKEYNALINEIAKSLKSTKKLEVEPSIPEDDPVGGEVPLDEVLPPSKGHTVGAGVPNTSANKQPYYGGPWIEQSLNDRLCALLEEAVGSGDQTSTSQDEVEHGKVGTVGILGHGSGKSGTVAGKTREEADPLTKRKAISVEARKEKKDGETEEDVEEMQDAMKSLGVDLG